jgi:hypothetical protein
MMLGSKMDIGFTGTRQPSTPESEAAFVEAIQTLQPTVFRHGACKGWDALAVRIVRKLFPTCRIIAYPGKSANATSDERPDRDAESIALSDEVKTEANHFQRNRNIVSDCEKLIGCPATSEWQSQGGTWMTLTYAKKHGKFECFIDPKGRCIYEF